MSSSTSEFGLNTRDLSVCFRLFFPSVSVCVFCFEFPRYYRWCANPGMRIPPSSTDNPSGHCSKPKPEPPNPNPNPTPLLHGYCGYCAVSLLLFVIIAQRSTAEHMIIDTHHWSEQQ
eukprot:TRINITY_DN21020_c0_g1_i1.p1 TRINITY_DN21020_c0_g1~~TRINITY_DN21020_c0_g1_i1.p1  ORF type:complete len:117 (-),score=7.86 TRINITY_DN21020_c0_g1_i1:44-394(-)